jgi:hypothetical protein
MFAILVNRLSRTQRVDCFNVQKTFWGDTVLWENEFKRETVLVTFYYNIAFTFMIQLSAKSPLENFLKFRWERESHVPVLVYLDDFRGYCDLALKPTLFKNNFCDEIFPKNIVVANVSVIQAVSLFSSSPHTISYRTS